MTKQERLQNTWHHFDDEREHLRNVSRVNLEVWPPSDFSSIGLRRHFWLCRTCLQDLVYWPLQLLPSSHPHNLAAWLGLS